MRCQRAHQWMAAAVDGELAPRRRRALDRHVAACASCRAELTATERTLAVLEGLPMEAPVSAALEQATLRRVRLAAADEAERGPAVRWRTWLPLPAFAVATAAVVVLAIGIVQRTGQVPAPVAAVRPSGTAAQPVAKAPAGESPKVARAPIPAEPPPKLAEAPDLFVDLPILRNMDKLKHFEAIETTTLDDEPGTPDGQEPPSNG